MNNIWKPALAMGWGVAIIYLWKKNRIVSIILLVLLIIALLVWYAVSVWDRLTFNIYFKSVDLSGLNLADLEKILLGETKVIHTTIGADLENKNPFSISFSNLKVKMFYENALIAETSDKIKNTKYTVPAKGNLSIEDTADIILNPSSVNLIAQGLTNRKPNIDYTVNLRVWGIPLPRIKNDFAWDY